jgi:hypothetical protein
MARSTLFLAATTLAVANGFMAPAHSGLALRSHRDISASAFAPSKLVAMQSVRRRSTAPMVSMQLEHLAEQATLLASYPEGFVNGMTSYFNLCECALASACGSCVARLNGLTTADGPEHLRHTHLQDPEPAPVHASLVSR